MCKPARLRAERMECGEALLAAGALDARAVRLLAQAARQLEASLQESTHWIPYQHSACQQSHIISEPD